MAIGALITRITQEILNPLIVLVFLLAVVAFGWGMVMYLAAQGSDEKVQKGKKIMWFGIIGMFVLASIWGIVGLLCDFFGTCIAGFSAPGIPVSAPPPPGAGIDCSRDIREMTSTECTYCYGASSCNAAPGDTLEPPVPPAEAETLTVPQQRACLNSPSVCEPCRHFLDEGRPRDYVRCVRNILGF